MPVQTDRRTVAANTTVENVLAGTKWEFPARPTAVQIFGAKDTATGTVLVDLSVGNVVAGENLDINTQAAGVGPLNDTDELISAVAMPGDRIQVRLRETGGVNTPTRLRIKFVES